MAVRLNQLVSIFCIIYYYFGNVNAIAQNDSSAYIISHRTLSVEDGLASREVFCGLQDNDGFIWFGTRNGLNRYDGKFFQVFTKQKNGLKDNAVIQLAKDNNNHIFIGYGQRGYQRRFSGLEVMDLTTHKIHSLKETFSNLPFREENVFWVANDGDDICFLVSKPYQYWRLSSNGFELKCEMKKWDEVNTIPNSEIEFQSSWYYLFKDGYSVISMDKLKYSYIVTPNKQETIANINYKIAGISPQKKIVWFNISNSEDKKVEYYQQKNASEFTKEDFLKLPPSAFSNLYTVQSSNDYDISVFAPSQGLYLYNHRSFYRLMDAKEFKGYTSFMSFFSDNLGNRWYCTPFGVIQVKLEKNRFTHYFTKAQTSNEKNNQTRGIYVNEKGLVYANVWDNICISNGIRTHSEIDYAMTYFNGEIYTGERYLTEYDEQKKAFSLPLFKAPNLVRGELCAIDSLTTDGLLLGFAKGIVTYNVVSKNVAAPINLNFPTPKFVYRFIKKEDHKIWAIAENGLFVLDNKADFIIDYWGPESKNKKKQLPFDRLHDAFVANDGIVWFATNGQGLFRWDKKGNDFKQFNITAGFPSDILYRIEEDAEHNLWISTDYGLVRFNTTDYKVSTYTTKEGISHNEFNRMSSFKAKDGRLFFGGLDGVNAFYPNQFSTDTSTTNAPLRIISYNQFSGKQDELLDQTAQLLEQKKIVLEPNDKFFILEFKLLDFEEGKSSYLFKIDGIDNEWNFLNQNSLRLSGIPFGNYTLRIRGQSQVGQKSSNEIVIPIEVLRPLIRKIGFQLFLLFVATLLVLFIIRFRTANLKRNSQLLAATVDKRTQQLRKTIGERDVLLKEIHHRVKNNLQVIVSLLSMHQKNIDSPELKQSFIEAKTNVRSISLIHENLYQHDSLAAVDMRSFADDLFKLINELFNSAKEKINFENNIVGAELDIETAVPLGLILNELFTNSFKYALNKEKELAITLTIKETSEQENYELVYSDNGKGLPANIDFLKTTTMGMSLIKDLCRQIGGKVHYENKNGCVFTIQFLSMKGRKQTD